MNDFKPCTGFCNEHHICIFLDCEFDKCFNDEIYQKRMKLENKIVKLVTRKKLIESDNLTAWQNFLDKVSSEVCLQYRCQYNANADEVKAMIRKNDMEKHMKQLEPIMVKLAAH